MRGMRWAAGAFVLMALVAGCSDDGGRDDAAASPSAPPSPSATASAPDASEQPVPEPSDVSVAPPPGTKPSAPSGACPPEGYRILEGVSDAAMGLRVVQIDLQNCGKKPIKLNGYPEIALQGDNGVRADVKIEQGSGGVSSVPSFDAAPQPITVAPGKTATSGILWRNLVEGGKSLTVDRVVVTPGPGLPAQRVDGLNIDLGTTRVLGVAPWAPGV
ncbi:DUF4232 domain-containing protein [Actinocorallia sp. A-T 12471]|uniref:DUF4232 domain-containing protein n=1 Tax=Actinocorallia sp. A-T 12471 TaxID=3089813 RepID=UPI0029D070B1|nr:DUF4232 domain-containing protein [Actinocorallia sp. A-T 12471]MDX6740061.1 DUF4232 domain-containing protein [Actinocorallia sp. A-T 12471]